MHIGYSAYTRITNMICIVFYKEKRFSLEIITGYFIY